MAFLLKWSYFFALFPFVSCLMEQYTITRTSTKNISQNVDIFNVPASKCRTPVLQCSRYYNALSSTTEQCTCSCPQTAATFGHEGSWSCQNNTEVRAQTGCKFKFTSELDADPFKILRKDHTPLPTALLPSGSCSVDLASSKYFRCDSTWAALGPSGTTSSQIRIVIKRKLSRSRYYKYSFTVENVASLKGKFISLKFKCSQRSESSCLLFKMAGEMNCPVKIFQTSSTQTPIVKLTNSFHGSTEGIPVLMKSPGPGKEEPNSGQRGSSSGTVAAVVVIVILAMIIAAIIGFLVWKRKRGESLRIVDRLRSIVREVRSPPKAKKIEEPDEKTYAEIYEQSPQRPIQTRTDALIRGINNIAFEDPTSTYEPPKQQDEQPLYEEAGSVMQDESVNDAEGYLVPVDSPLYIELEPPEQTLDDGTTNNYDNPQKENERTNASRRGGAGSNVVTPAAASGPTAVVGTNRDVTKQRRRPPSPPRKRNEASSSGNDERQDTMGVGAGHQDATDVRSRKGVGLDNDCESNIYESLKEDERVLSLYEPLDRTTLSNN